MSVDAQPWSVPVRLDTVGRRLDRHLVADEADRARIAKALDLPAVNALEADIVITQTATTGEVRGRLKAQVVQVCGVTLEPFETAIEADFDVPFTTEDSRDPDETEDQEFSLADLDQPDVIENGVLDLGAYVTEHLSLELDPFPRKPGVEFEAPEPEQDVSPFAVLAKLRPKGGES